MVIREFQRAIGGRGLKPRLQLADVAAEAATYNPQQTAIAAALCVARPTNAKLIRTGAMSREK